MRVLVTGGAGFIGSHMAYALDRRGDDVVIIDNMSTGFKQAPPPNSDLILGNIADKSLLENIFSTGEIDAVAHFAGSIIVPDSVRHPLEYYQNNTLASHALIRAAIKANVKAFLFSSTAAVYGEGKDEPVDESAPLNPVNPYGWSKLMTETMLRDSSKAYSLPHACLRYFNVAGADPSGETGQSTPNATHLIKVAAQTALGQRSKMDIFGTDYPTPDGTCIRDYIHVADLIQAHLLTLDYLIDSGENLTANCGYGRGYSVHEVVNAMRRASGVEFVADEQSRRAGDPARVVACSDFIRNKLNWQPKYDDLDLIVNHALNWERELCKGRWS